MLNRKINLNNHPLNIRYIIFDPTGAIASQSFNTDDVSKKDDYDVRSYINDQTDKPQKGIYAFIREAKAINGNIIPSLKSLSDFQVNPLKQTVSGVNGRLIYISPLTSIISILPIE